MKKIGIVGAGAMGSGIAQVAATSGHPVVVYDSQLEALQKAETQLNMILNRLVDKGRIKRSDAETIGSNISWSSSLDRLEESNLVIEAIVENLTIKKEVFARLESIVSPDAILATNTSSLSVAAIAQACNRTERVLGLHFFNPPTLMPLVEVIPALGTSKYRIGKITDLMKSWNKIPVVAQDTPGFIVNRIARPFYGEALKILEEGWLGIPRDQNGMAGIDHSLKTIGGFRMGPFELMDYIGLDVNYAVNESVFKSMYYDPRYQPSLLQKRRMEAGWLGRKTGRGFYTYEEGSGIPNYSLDDEKSGRITERILAMLINEAVDAWYLNIAGEEDIEIAMKKGVNYPKGLIEWGREWGFDKVEQIILELRSTYHSERYRPSLGLKYLR